MKRILFSVVCISLATAGFAKADVSDKNAQLIQAAKDGDPPESNLPTLAHPAQSRYEIGTIQTAGNRIILSNQILAKVRSKVGQLFDAAAAAEDAKRIAEITGVEYIYYNTTVVDGKVQLVFVVKEKTDIPLLIQAAQDGNLPAVQTLLEEGADVNAKDTYGFTALMTAAQKGHTEIVKLLLEKGADVNARNTSGTALCAALRGGHTDIVKLLLEKGADVNAEMIDGGTTALMMASRNGNTEVVKLLLKKGADVNAKRTYDGETALWAASWGGHTDIVKLLLKKGADVNAKRTYDGETALWAASWGGHTEIVKLLLEKGADVNAKANTNNGTTALCAAVRMAAIRRSSSSCWKRALMLM